jgi:hypothetical protein
MIAAGVGIHGRSGRALLRGRRQLRSICSQVLEQFDSGGKRSVWSISLTKSFDSFLSGTANPVPRTIEVRMVVEGARVISLVTEATASLTDGEFFVVIGFGVLVGGVGRLRVA